MHDDAVRVEDAFTVVSGALSQAARRSVALENPPVAMPCADSVTVGGGAASSPSPAIQQAAQLASWEDEGGTTSG